MMGRGVIHPLDMDHGQNPPSNPELMDALAARFTAMKHDTKSFLRELALSQTYQRSSVLPAGSQEPAPESFLVANSKRISAEQFTWSVLTATWELERVSKAADAKPATTAPVKLVGLEAKRAAKEAEKNKPITLAEARKRFVVAFAAPMGEPEVEPVASLAGAQFGSNSEIILDSLKPRSGNQVARLEMFTYAAAVADELYLSVLSRRPDAGERADVADYLAKHKDRRVGALGELAWSLLASTEFFVNH
jgi:hypothetical protein